MQIPFLIVKERKEWMITWRDNKARWILLYYLVGLIVACLIAFAEETLFSLPIRYLYKSLCVTVVIPLVVVVSWTWWARKAER